MSLTTDPNDSRLQSGRKKEGQNEVYLVLSDEERAKGFVRPYRDVYVHVGKWIRDEGTVITLEEGLQGHSDWAKSHYTKENGWAAFLQYPPDRGPGRFLTIEEYEGLLLGRDRIGGCGRETKMGQALSETYARNPKFYGATFCVHCNKHFPVDEFVWQGTDIIVGS